MKPATTPVITHHAPRRLWRCRFCSRILALRDEDGDGLTLMPERRRLHVGRGVFWIACERCGVFTPYWRRLASRDERRPLYLPEHQPKGGA